MNKSTINISTDRDETMPDNRIEVFIDSDLEELIPGFLKGRRTDTETIRNSLETEDFETIQLLGHSMKGNGAGYGFDEISNIGKRVEMAAKEKNINEIRQCLLDLLTYLDDIDIVFE